MRRSSPIVAVHSSSHASRGCSGTWLCTKIVQADGSRPAASRLTAASSVLDRRTAGLDLQREGVQVDDAVERVVLALVGHPAAQCPEVVAQVQVA